MDSSNSGTIHTEQINFTSLEVSVFSSVASEAVLYLLPPDCCRCTAHVPKANSRSSQSGRTDAKTGTVP